MGLADGFFADEAEVVVKRSASLEQFLEVALAYLHGAHSFGYDDTAVLAEQRAVVVELGFVAESFDEEKAELPEVHDFEVEVAHHVGGEVVAGHIEEQLVGRDLRGGEEQHQIVGLFRCEREVKVGGFAVKQGRVVGQADIPDHAAHVGGAAVEFSALGKAFEI